MNGVYYTRPEIKPWQYRRFLIGGWCIEVTNGMVTRTFYQFQLPFWSLFWSEEKEYRKMIEMIDRWCKKQDAKIVKAQRMWDAMEAVRGVKP